MKLLLAAATVLVATLGIATIARGNPAGSEQGEPSLEPAQTGRSLSDVPGTRMIDLIFMLKADDRGLTRAAHAVSIPGSDRFRRYLDSDEIARRFGPPPEVRQSVIETLADRGISSRSDPDGLWVEATATAKQAESLFSTDLRTYAGAPGQARFIAPAMEPSVPPGLAGKVEAVVGLSTRGVVEAGRSGQALSPAAGNNSSSRSTRQAKLRRMTSKEGRRLNRFTTKRRSSIRANLGTQKGCRAGRNAKVPVKGFDSFPSGLKNTYIPAYTPNQIHTAYGINRLHRKGLRGHGQRIAVIEIDGFKRSDLRRAARCFGYRAPPTPVKLVGLKKRLPPGGETTLDLQVIAAAVPRAKEIRVVQGPNSYATLVKQHRYVLQLPRKRRPSVVSASLGVCEAEIELSYVKAMQRVYKLAAIKGVTMIASSGDTGSSGCTLDGNTMAVGRLSVQYGASSPWVTGVGGTNFTLNKRNAITEEVVWNNSPLSFGGGTGGASRIFTQPKWQRGPGVGKSNRRTVPDVALLADNTPGWSIFCSVKGVCNGGWSSVGGTSAAAPLTASIALMANQKAARKGRPALGFLNPAIYRIARKNRKARKATFRDVRKVGNDLGKMIGPENDGNNKPLGCCKAKRNYDRASGWGSVKAPHFIDQMLKQPRKKPKR
jgi:subtilase family serine protease